MTKPIEPAMTPEEWAIRGVVRAGHDGAIGFIACDDGMGVGYDADHAGVDWIYPKGEACPAIMALANAALPDDSPYKIAREDVTTLRLVVGVIMRYGEAQRMSDLADKLDALLPPETP